MTEHATKFSTAKQVWEAAAAERKNPKRKPIHYFSNLALLDVFKAVTAIEVTHIEHDVGGPLSPVLRYKVANIAEVLDDYPEPPSFPDGDDLTEEQEREAAHYLYEVSKIMHVVYPRAAHAITANRNYRTVEAIASAMFVVMPAHLVHSWRKHWIDAIKHNQLPASTHDLGAAYDQTALKTTGKLVQTDTRPADERQSEFMHNAAQMLAEKLSAKPRPIR